MSVGVIISGTAAMMIWNATRQRAETSVRGELYEQAAAAMDVMSRYLREVPQDECPEEPEPCLHGKAQITVADQAALSFGDIGFRLAGGGGTLEMTVDGGGSWQCVTREVAGFAFAYWDRHSNALTGMPLTPGHRNAVRQIGVDLVLSRGGQDAHLRTRVYLRNFMDEVKSDP